MNWVAWALYGASVVAAGMKQANPALTPVIDWLLSGLQFIGPTGLLFTQSVVKK